MRNLDKAEGTPTQKRILVKLSKTIAEQTQYSAEEIHEAFLDTIRYQLVGYQIQLSHVSKWEDKDRAEFARTVIDQLLFRFHLDHDLDLKEKLLALYYEFLYHEVD